MTKFNKQFKVDAVQYYHEHRELGLIGCAHNLGISQQTLSRWQKQLRDIMGKCHIADPETMHLMKPRKSLV